VDGADRRAVRVVDRDATSISTTMITPTVMNSTTITTPADRITTIITRTIMPASPAPPMAR
jgi:hypothetical protein